VLKVLGITKNYPNFSFKVDELFIKKSNYFVLLGPTGSGKTLLMNLLAGLVLPTRGEVYHQDKNITFLSPEKRGFGIVYQDSALFPHLDVVNNIAFGLKIKKISKKDIELKIKNIMQKLDIFYLYGRDINNLSGGEKQRVAIARALVLEPDLLLFDEPFSALDYQTKEEMIRLLKQIQKDYQPTIFHITHDFEDALTLADKIAVMKEGRIIQQGKPNQVFSKPFNRFVANFVGAKNVISGRLKGQGEETSFVVNEQLEIQIGYNPSENFSNLAISSEYIIISKGFLNEKSPNSFWGQVLDIIPKRGINEVEIDIGLKVYSFLTTRSLQELGLKKNDKVNITLDSNGFHFF